MGNALSNVLAGKKNVLLVASTDLSHYLQRDQARAKDVLDKMTSGKISATNAVHDLGIVQVGDDEILTICKLV